MAVNPETTTRKLVSMPKELVQEIENYRFENRIKTESEAIRQLIKLGLDAFKKAS
ncbi:ribbon-helix-helix domain-containing protein [Acetobacter senegalensis]|uniref:ribbon-helix-helix domain-containing protein n=1 Tax=Acetobacter senegalensis TaxID=446692 RepID=UPI00264BF647|nr:ribbon-helix-helix domain-containing protein [Acetobacter senegalensis]MDN7354301.1 ribbon-helix-helix domain-containing protein [Acetobacter senegalensis]